ncbi:hypothetical protein GCM10023214_47090 [Amycolatopsis dongchuanensis]|uniref:Short chain dehydrogenase n=1 Tax=Amycolatopsis dongchuanensis TaxID=1070866 RepID=A0ABP9QZG1_9PSEU
MGGQAVAVPADVTDPVAMRALADAAERECGRIDIWVNGTGVAAWGEVERITEEFGRVLPVVRPRPVVGGRRGGGRSWVAAVGSGAAASRGGVGEVRLRPVVGGRRDGGTVGAAGDGAPPPPVGGASGSGAPPLGAARGCSRRRLGW